VICPAARFSIWERLVRTLFMVLMKGEEAET